MLIDTHCHLDRLDLTSYDGSLDKLVAETVAAGVKQMICIGIDVESSADVVNIAARYPEVFATVGVHPSDVGDNLPDIDALARLAREEKVVAIGESGLDYYYNEPSSFPLQQESFRAHVGLANQLSKPIVIHTRAAHRDTIQIMREEKAQAGVMHCFTESWEMAKEALDMGFYVSISGIVTFKNAENVREIARQVPLDRLLIETDAPYLAPVPKRGKKNEPKFVQYVAEFMAELRGIAYGEFVGVMAQNARTLFGLPR